GRHPQDAVSVLAEAFDVSSHPSQLSNLTRDRRDLRHWLDALYQPRAGFSAWAGSRSRNTSAGNPVAAVLLAWDGSAICAARSRPQSIEQRVALAQAPSRQDRSRHRHRHDPGGSDDLLQLAGLPEPLCPFLHPPVTAGVMSKSQQERAAEMQSERYTGLRAQVHSEGRR